MRPMRQTLRQGLREGLRRNGLLRPLLRSVRHRLLLSRLASRTTELPVCPVHAEYVVRPELWQTLLG